MRIGSQDLKRGSYKSAIKLFNDAYSLDSTFIDPQVRLAALSYIVGDCADSVRWGKKALQLSSRHYNALITLAANYENLHKREEAERTYRRVLMLCPWSNHATAGLVRMLFNSKQPVPEFIKTETETE